MCECASQKETSLKCGLVLSPRAVVTLADYLDFKKASMVFLLRGKSVHLIYVLICIFKY